MTRELEAQISAAAAAVTATASTKTPTSGPSTFRIDEDDILGETPQEVKNLSVRFAGLPQDEIVKIFRNKFKPINLARLRHMKGDYLDTYVDQDRIGIENGSLRLRKTSADWKDFGKSPDIWLKGFDNYAMIMVSLFGAVAPDLNAALSLFKGDILQLAEVYKWQEGVLRLAIAIHTHIIGLQPSDPLSWIIPPAFQAKFCNPMTIIGMNEKTSGRRKRSQSPSYRDRQPRAPGGPTNHSDVICESFNKGSCPWPGCERAHKCKGCGAKDHGLASCKKGKAADKP